MLIRFVKQVPSTMNFYPENPIKIIGGHFMNGFIACNTSSMDNAVNSAELIFYLRQTAAGCIKIGDIAAKIDCVSTHALESFQCVDDFIRILRGLV